MQKKKEEISQDQIKINNKLSEMMKLADRVEIPIFEYDKSNKELL